LSGPFQSFSTWRATGRREPLPAAAVACGAAQVPAAAPAQRGPAVLDLRQSVVRRSAQIASHCQAPRRCRGGIDGAEVVTGPSDHLRERKIRIWVSAWTIGKYMTPRHHRGPSPGWREFLKRHESNIRACEFFCVRTILFQTLYVFLWSDTPIEKFCTQRRRHIRRRSGRHSR
jgi:hypothetical protein